MCCPKRDCKLGNRRAGHWARPFAGDSERKSGIRALPDQRKEPGVLDELPTERKNLLERESAELEKQASQLAEEIKELTGDEPTRIK